MDRMTKLENEVKKVTELAKEFKKRNGNSKLKISKDDFNLWVISKFMEQGNRITVLETKNKMLMWFCGISLTIVSVICAYMKI